MELEIIKKKINFTPNNDIRGWVKLNDGTRSSFEVTPTGDVRHWGTNTHVEIVHPIISGLLEMLYDDR